VSAEMGGAQFYAFSNIDKTI